MILLFPVFLYSAPSGLTLYILASTLAFLWAQAFYWWKRLPDEEQICVRDMFDEWFCERGVTARLTLRNHPTVTVQNLNNRDGSLNSLKGFSELDSRFFCFFNESFADCFSSSQFLLFLVCLKAYVFLFSNFLYL